jgi:hypothetical protein
MGSSFVILRQESVGGYSTRGPVAQPVTLKEAQSEIVRLKKLFPYQDFVIMGKVGRVTRSEHVTVRIDAPDLSEVAPKKRAARKVLEASDIPPRTLETLVSIKTPEGWNVVPLRKEEGV